VGGGGRREGFLPEEAGGKEGRGDLSVKTKED